MMMIMMMMMMMMKAAWCPADAALAAAVGFRGSRWALHGCRGPRFAARDERCGTREPALNCGSRGALHGCRASLYSDAVPDFGEAILRISGMSEAVCGSRSSRRPSERGGMKCGLGLPAPPRGKPLGRETVVYYHYYYYYYYYYRRGVD